MKKRCEWCGDDPLYVAYHDDEWGVPVYDDRELFSKLILDGAQAGLSWITILRKRENYYQAFDQFDPIRIAADNDKKVAALMQDSGIIRNQGKIRAVIRNAGEFLRIRNELGSFSQFLWDFVGGEPIVNTWSSTSQLPSTSPESEAMSAALKNRGFLFVGPTICYAFMQAVGMVNDHVLDCFSYAELTSQGDLKSGGDHDR